MQKIHPAIIFPLKYNQELALDMDSLMNNQEESVIEFVGKATDLVYMKLWSRYTKLEDVDALIKS